MPCHNVNLNRLCRVKVLPSGQHIGLFNERRLYRNLSLLEYRQTRNTTSIVQKSNDADMVIWHVVKTWKCQTSNSVIVARGSNCLQSSNCHHRISTIRLGWAVGLWKRFRSLLTPQETHQLVELGEKRAIKRENLFDGNLASNSDRIVRLLYRLN